MPPQRAQRREMRRPLPRWGSDDGSDREASAEHDACRSKFGNLGCRGLGGCIYPAGLTRIRQRAANEVEAEYTTSHVLISETARESVPITIFFDPQVTGVEWAECFTNLNGRDWATADPNGNGVQEGISPPF